MTDRKMTVLRLVVFCVLSFVPFWIILPMMNAAYGEPVYMSEAAAPAVYALGSCPSGKPFRWRNPRH